MRTLDDVIRAVSKLAALSEADLDKDICHYLMMYRYLLRKQAEEEEKDRNKKKAFCYQCYRKEEKQCKR